MHEPRHLSKSFDVRPEWEAFTPDPGVTFQACHFFGFGATPLDIEELAAHRRFTTALALPMSWFEAAGNVARMYPGGLQTVGGAYARKLYLEHELLR